MKKNLSEINTNKIKQFNINNTKKISSLSQSSSSSELYAKQNKSHLQSTKSTINIESNEISSFNIESLITLEDAISYFFDPKISPKPSSFIDYFKTIRYFMFNISVKKLFQNKEKNNSKNIEIIENLLNLQFLCILMEGILLPCCKENNRIHNMIKSCISSSHQNFLLLCQIIINELNKYSYTNIYMNKLTKIILKKSLVRTGYKPNDIFNKIDKKNKEILSHLKNILNINKTLTKLRKGLSPLSLVLKTIDKLSTNWTIDYCFKVLGLNEKQIKEIKEATYLELEDDSTPLYLPIKVPFLDNLDTNSYILTVVLDLDETLIRYNINENTSKNELIKRPCLDEFLSSLSRAKCELIIFTASTQEYADPLIDQIENDKKYFSKRLYRQHTVLIGDNYIKDITKLGRELNRTIIVDNEKSSFSLQQRNGILIKPFFGEEDSFNLDMALENLSIILLKIIKNPFQDIRKELEIYKDEIENKVTKDI